MADETGGDSATCQKKEPLSPSSTEKPSVDAAESPEELVTKCNCVNSQSENGGSSDTESVHSNSSSASSFMVISNLPTHTKQKCCLKQRFGSIFNRKRSSDVLFIVGQGEQKQEIPAHTLVLSVGSDIFNIMFSEDWSSNSAEIEVPDIEPAAFTAVLRFLYTDEILLTADTVMAILYAARKYAVEPLENPCVDFLVKNLCSDNVFTILNEGILLDLQKLINSCLEIIDTDTLTTVSADGFCDATIETLCLVLSRSTLRISEIRLFEALVRWCEAECLRQNLFVNKENQQSALKKVLPLMRFPLMSVEEFSSKVVPTGLLSKDELLSLLLFFTTKPRPPTNFSILPRSYQEITVNRFKRFEQKFEIKGNGGDVIDFTCDHDMNLLGYGLYNSVSGSSKHGVTLQLKDTLTGSFLRNESADFDTDDCTITYRALFKQPIKLTAFKKYTAFVCIKGPDCFIGKDGLKDVIVNLSNGQKATVTFETYVYKEGVILRTTVNQGLIPQLIFQV